MQALKLLRHPALWGAGAIVLAVVVALVTGWVYSTPPGQKTVTFYADDAASIHPGDQVRIAGINVGKVKDLALEPKRVRVRARVDGYAFVGNRSQIEIRMLTPVGGYYVDIVSLGNAPLGNQPIPSERVKLPYSLMRVMADATTFTEKLDAKPLRESLDQLQHGLSGTNVESLSAIIDAGNGIMSTMEQQRGQVTEILDLSDEWIRALSNFRDGLREIIRKISIIQQTFALTSKRYGDTILVLGRALIGVSPVAAFYVKHRDKFLEKIHNWMEEARMWTEHNGAIVRGLRLVRNKIERVLDADHAPPELLATDLCIPAPGSPC